MTERDASNPKTFRIVRYYRDIGVWEGWGLERFKKACALLQESPEELAASCAIPNSKLRQWMNRGRFPSYAALLFHMREQDWFRAKKLKE